MGEGGHFFLNARNRTVIGVAGGRAIVRYYLPFVSPAGSYTSASTLISWPDFQGLSTPKVISRLPTTTPADRDWPPNITPAGICICRTSSAARFFGILNLKDASGLPDGVSLLRMISSLLLAGGAKAAESSVGNILHVVNSIR